MKMNLKRSMAILFILLMLVFIVFFAYLKSKIPTTLSEKAYYGATLGGNYLTRNINEDGSFVYKYNIKEDKIYPEYNVLRHAGTIYALLELYDVTKDKKYLNTAKKALGYLKSNIKKCPEPNSDLDCVYEGDKMKLGGNALSVLAFTKYQEVANSDEYLSDAVSLTEWMLKTQTEQGEFKIHSQSVDGTINSVVSEYYPGESIYALMNIYKITKEDRYLDGAQRAVSWIINVRDGNKTSKDISHDHWLLYGIKELYKYNPSKEYVEHAKKIVDGIIALQYIKNVPIEWVGGYYNPPRSTPTATRGEALSSAYEIFKMANENKYAEKTYVTLQRGIVFELRTFIDGRAARSCVRPVKCLGGFRSALNSGIVRIDYVQHNISALLGYYRITNEINLQ